MQIWLFDFFKYVYVYIRWFKTLQCIFFYSNEHIIKMIVVPIMQVPRACR